MSTVQEIETAIGQLPRQELCRLVAWMQERFADEWDSQIEEDLRAGRLASLAQEALAEHRAGRTKPFPAREKSRHR